METERVPLQVPAFETEQNSQSSRPSSPSLSYRQLKLDYVDQELQEMVQVTASRVTCPLDQISKQFDLSLLQYPNLFNEEVQKKYNIEDQKEIVKKVRDQALKYSQVISTDFREQLYPDYHYQAKRGQSFGIILVAAIVYCLGFWMGFDFSIVAVFFLVIGIFMFALNYLRRAVTITQQFELKKETIISENKKFNSHQFETSGFQIYISSYLAYMYIEFKADVVNKEVYAPDFELNRNQEDQIEIIQKCSEMNQPDFEQFSYEQKCSFGLLFDYEQVRHPNLLFNHCYQNRSTLLAIFGSTIPQDLVQVIKKKAIVGQARVATWSVNKQSPIDIQPYRITFHDKSLESF